MATFIRQDVLDTYRTFERRISGIDAESRRPNLSPEKQSSLHKEAELVIKTLSAERTSLQEKLAAAKTQCQQNDKLIADTPKHTRVYRAALQDQQDYFKQGSILKAQITRVNSIIQKGLDAQTRVKPATEVSPTNYGRIVTFLGIGLACAGLYLRFGA